jgi:hypothetical protein
MAMSGRDEIKGGRFITSTPDKFTKIDEVDLPGELLNIATVAVAVGIWFPLSIDFARLNALLSSSTKEINSGSKLLSIVNNIRFELTEFYRWAIFPFCPTKCEPSEFQSKHVTSVPNKANTIGKPNSLYRKIFTY